MKSINNNNNGNLRSKWNEWKLLPVNKDAKKMFSSEIADMYRAYIGRINDVIEQNTDQESLHTQLEKLLEALTISNAQENKVGIHELYSDILEDKKKLINDNNRDKFSVMVSDISCYLVDGLFNDFVSRNISLSFRLSLIPLLRTLRISEPRSKWKTFVGDNEMQIYNKLEEVKAAIEKLKSQIKKMHSEERKLIDAKKKT